MYPAERDEVVLVLHQKQLLLVLRVAVIRTAALLRDDDVRHRERVPRLTRERATLHTFFWTLQCPANGSKEEVERYQFSAEDPTRLHGSHSVAVGQL